MARKDKVIGHPLDAKVTIIPGEGCTFLSWADDAAALKETLIVSELEVLEKLPENNSVGLSYLSGRGAESKDTCHKCPASGEKCERCWNYSTSVGSDKEMPEVCDKCLQALR